jgi:hypothetical protein
LIPLSNIQCEVAKPRVVIGSNFLCEKSKIVCIKNKRHIVAQLVNGKQGKTRKKKHVQFVVIWHFLKQGHSLINFENFKEFFQKN